MLATGHYLVGEGGREGYCIWEEGQDFLSATLGRSTFFGNWILLKLFVHLVIADITTLLSRLFEELLFQIFLLNLKDDVRC